MNSQDLKRELNRILDKINKVGYHKLSRKEKKFLKIYGDLIDKDE